MKEKYTAVILVIASQDSDVKNTRYIIERLKPEWKPLYSVMRSVWLAYHQVNPNMKVVFVYGGGTKEFEPQSYDWIYENVFENNHPGILQKTLLAMKDATELYDYDFLVRTNLSTFWDLNNLETRLALLPKSKCLTGTEIRSKDPEGNSYHYIAGYDMVFSRDLIEDIIPHSEEVLKQRVYCNMEDLSLCEAVKKYSGVNLYSSQRSHAAHLSMNPYSDHIYTKNLNTLKCGVADHIRVKTRTDRNSDKKALINLLNDVYSKSIL